MEAKWFAIGLIGVVFSLAIMLIGFQIATAPVGVACAEAGMEWYNGNCLEKTK